MIFKVSRSVVYCIINHYVCADYLCCPQTKLNVANKIFENTTINDISETGIIELLISIVSCHVFVKDTK